MSNLETSNNQYLMVKNLMLSLLISIGIVLPAIAQSHTVPGEITSPFPTLNNLALEWLIQGDDNQNGLVIVEFREKGSVSWRKAMPLRRVPAGGNVNFKWENKHSGSIFDLSPNTLYQIKLQLNDPDGGSYEKNLEVATRPEPVIPSGAEIIDIKPGVYDTLSTKSGTQNRPVVYQCSEGIAIFKFIDLRNRKWVYVEGLTVDNTVDRGIGVRMDGAENCVVRGCTINAVFGVVAYNPRATNCYVSDNVITGVSLWTNAAMGGHGNNIGEGIEMTGPGNVICFNKVTGFRDGISTMEDSHTVNQQCIDIHNNDIYSAADDGIEADFCFSNCRVYNNRLTNIYVGLSSQPGLGGPNYFMRNVMYNAVHAAFKLKRFSQGDVVMHNTVIKVGTGLGGNSAMDYAFFRNNLAFGGPTGGINWGDYGAGEPFASDIIEPGEHSSFDYNAVGVYGTEYLARIGGKPFAEVEPNGVEKLKLEDTFHMVDFPNPPIPERKVPDLRPKPGSPVIDGGIYIPNVNDGFSGKAPDIGAYELGQAMPHYGPRPK